MRSISSTADGPSSRHNCERVERRAERLELRNEQPAILRPRNERQFRLRDHRERALGTDE